jgi:hypothetical protein
VETHLQNLVIRGDKTDDDAFGEISTLQVLVYLAGQIVVDHHGHLGNGRQEG